MIYLKLDKSVDSEALQRHNRWVAKHKEALDQAWQLCEEIGLTKEHQLLQRGNHIAGFSLKDGFPTPEGLIQKKGDLYLTPDRRSKKGKEIEKKIVKIVFPDADDYMKEMFGVTGHAFVGRNLYSGCSFKSAGDSVLIQAQPEVWEAARKKEKFNRPDGLISITYEEYASEQVRTQEVRA